MARFIDAKGETWEIDITAGTIKEVAASELKVDLGKPDEGDPPLITRFNTDVEFIVDLLYEVCRKQCDERGLKPIDFAHRLKGESLADAHRAFRESWCDFFLFRPDLAEVIRRAGAWTQKLAETRLAKMASPEYDAAVEKALAAVNALFDEELGEAPQRIKETMRRPAPGRSAANLPESPDVIRLPARSES